MSDTNGKGWGLYAGVVVVGVLGVGVGYLIGRKRSDQKDGPWVPPVADLELLSDEEDEEEEDEEDEEEDTGEKYKMVLCVRNDLKMGKGKACAQCGHATLGAYLSAKRSAVRAWMNRGQPKIALRVNNLEDLNQLQARVLEAGLNSFLVVDAGCTQLSPDTPTVLGVGPAPASEVDRVCGHLKLF